MIQLNKRFWFGFPDKIQFFWLLLNFIVFALIGGIIGKVNPIFYTIMVYLGIKLINLKTEQ